MRLLGNALRLSLHLIDDDGAARGDAEVTQPLEVVVERLGYILQSGPQELHPHVVSSGFKENMGYST